MARKPVGATATKWHEILGHAGPDAIEQLPKHVNGAVLTELTNERAPLKIKREICSKAKHTKIYLDYRSNDYLDHRPKDLPRLQIK